MSKLVSILLLCSTSVGAATLKEAYQSARLNMETLKRADATIEQRQELKNQARAGMLPTIAGVGNYTKIDEPDASGVNRAFILTKQYSAALRLTQPLLRGGAIGAYQFAKESILLSEFQRDASDINLYQLVINAYFGLKAAQLDIQNLEELLKASRERVNEIRERTKIGRSRRGELVEAEAQLHTADAQYKQGLFQIEQAQRMYEFYTQLKAENIPDLSPVAPIKGSLEDYLTKLKNRPDLLANDQQVRVADRQVEISKGGHYPSVDLVSNYYFDRTGVLASSEWDAALVFNVPLFQGGGVAAQVRESVAAKRVAQLNSQEAKRAAERDLAILYRNYTQIVDQLNSLKTALSKAEEAYRLNRNDYKYGIVTNLDVLQSLNVYIQTKRSYNNLFVLAHQATHSLDAATGVLP